MKIDARIRRGFQIADENIPLRTKNLIQAVTDRSWPIPSEITTALQESVTRLRGSYSGILTAPDGADFDGTAIAAATQSLKDIIPKLKYANQRAAVDYMAGTGDEKAIEACDISHRTKSDIVVIEKSVCMIDNMIPHQGVEKS